MAESEGLIGAPLPRPGIRRLAEGKGRYTDDIAPPGLLHAAFLRSPHAHARILDIDTRSAGRVAGVFAVYTGHDLAAICRPWVTRLAAAPGHFSAPQYPLALEEVCWQGEAVAAVLAESRAAAEDGVRAIKMRWEILPAVMTPQEAAAADAPPVHCGYQQNLCLQLTLGQGDVEAAFANAAHLLRHRFHFSRLAGISLEPRSILAQFDSTLGELTVHQSHQAPFQMREIFAEQLGLDVRQVRVIAPDVGGAFGVKLHAYADEMAAVAMAMLSGRPVRFTCDRREGLLTDVQAREAVVEAAISLDDQGRITGLEVDVLGGFGAYSCYPRSSVGDPIQAAQLAGAPYHIGAFRARVRGVYQNKPPSGAYRGVGQPLAVMATEQMIDIAAAACGLDPAELRRRNFRKTEAQPAKTEGGVVVETLSLRECLASLTDAMDYQALRAEQTELRQRGIWRGIGLAAFVELTGVGPGLYGPQGIRVSAQEACRVSLTETGRIICETSVTEQGQGVLATLQQIVAQAVGVAPGDVVMVAGDTARTPYGGGAWASRGIALGGEAALRAGAALRGNILAIAGALLQSDTESLSICAGEIRNADGVGQLGLAELAAIVRFRSNTIPLNPLPPLECTEHFVPHNLPYLATNGVHGALVELDRELGSTKILKYWAADDCGRIINPLLVDEQVRGGVVQGIGTVLYEGCRYDNAGQMLNTNFTSYPIVVAADMPEIRVLHIASRTAESRLGARGVGEAGMIGASGAIWTAVNDALRPAGVWLDRQPFTSEMVLEKILGGRG